MFGFHYLRSFVLALAISAAIGVGGIFTAPPGKKFGGRGVLVTALALLPLVGWVVYFISTAAMTSVLSGLDSDDPQVALHTYDTTFKQVTTLDGAVRLAVNEQESGNVRFYAACLVADLLATNTPTAEVNVLAKVENAPAINTHFSGGNRLTEGFYLPGEAQAQVFPRQVIEGRLMKLRQARR